MAHRRLFRKTHLKLGTPTKLDSETRKHIPLFGAWLAECSEWEHLVRRLDQLTPGGFAVAALQFEMWDEPATPVRLYEVLKKECEAKVAAPRKIGY